jgi:hypothetical protein
MANVDSFLGDLPIAPFFQRPDAFQTIAPCMVSTTKAARNDPIYQKILPDLKPWPFSSQDEFLQSERPDARMHKGE